MTALLGAQIVSSYIFWKCRLGGSPEAWRKQLLGCASGLVSQLGNGDYHFDLGFKAALIEGLAALEKVILGPIDATYAGHLCSGLS